MAIGPDPNEIINQYQLPPIYNETTKQYDPDRYTVEYADGRVEYWDWDATKGDWGPKQTDSPNEKQAKLFKQQQSIAQQEANLAEKERQFNASKQIPPSGNYGETPFVPVIGADGQMAWVKDPNYDPAAAALKRRLTEAQIASAERVNSGSPTEWGNLSARQAEQAWREIWEPQQQRMQMAQSIFGNLNNSFTQLLPYAARPGQEYRMGFEPGGPYQQLREGGGGSYDPNYGRIVRVQYSPQDMMNQAWQMAVVPSNQPPPPEQRIFPQPLQGGK